MTPFQAYIALIKGYCGACVLFIPKAFANGGFVFSILSMSISGAITTLGAIKLVQVGLYLNSFNYGQIV